MIDEDKLKSKIEGLKSNLIHGACSSQIAMETCCKEEAYNEVLTILDSMQEEPISEDLEEAAWQYYDRNKPLLPSELVLHKELIDFFKAGARWQCEQMMKDAVDGLVYAQLTTSGEIMIRSNYFKSETLDYLDNVKLIIIKEDKV